MANSPVNDYPVLWSTCVGSHAWGMQRADSDIDIYRCYLAPSEDFLLGHMHNGGHQSQTADVDTVSFELGHLINQLRKGNLNHIIGLMSPVVEHTTTEHDALKEIFQDSLSKNAYNSIHGMAKSNFKRYFEDKPRTYLTDTEMVKKLGQVGRVIKFGIRLLLYHEVAFEAYQPKDRFEITGLMSELDDAYANSTLPDKPDARVYDDWLLKIRLDQLKT